MFKTSISSTPLTTDAANAYFQNIYGMSFNNDYTFIATLRALVAPRIRDGEEICLVFGGSNYNTNFVDGTTADRLVASICANYDPNYAENRIYIHSFNGNAEDNLANFRAIEERFTSCYDGYHRLDKIKAFYRKSFNVDCYINPDNKSVIVFVDKLDTRKIHYLQVSILAFLPWYFDAKEGISDLEMELLCSLRETSPEKYLNCIARIAEKYDFKSLRIRQLLAGFENRYEKKECDEVRAEISKLDDEMRRINEQFGYTLGRKNDALIRLMGLERKIAENSEDSEIMEYFLCNNKLYLEGVSDNEMRFAVKDYLTYFDHEMAERAINNTRSFVYTTRYGSITEADMKDLLYEIFIDDDPIIRIRFCAAYSFALNGRVSAQSRHNFSCEFSDCMPNPHINGYGCMGNYQTAINTLLAKRDYISAIEQCVASCKSLNWGDNIVMSNFMGSLWGNTRCIELPDGSVVKPSEAIAWLKKQKNDSSDESGREDE